MRKTTGILFCAILLTFSIMGLPGGWQESGEVKFSYAYARTWFGYQMRKQGWSCRLGFTSGEKRDMEHSIWQKGNRELQLMIWRIDSNRTGYAKGEIPNENHRRKTGKR